MRVAKKFLFFSFLIILSLNLLSGITPPEKFLGFKVGEDRKLADYRKIKEYFKLIEKESNRIKIFNLGKTTLGQDFIMAVISTSENIAKIEKWREISKKLSDPRKCSYEEALKLSKEGKVVILFTMSMHSTEVGASQMSMELAYDLITGKTPFNADEVLKNVIVLIMPNHNPDGLNMVVDWYNKYLGTEYEGGSMPWLYHHYAGHDNNRDWFMFNLQETKIVSKVYYEDWLPQIIVDQHQMGSTGARLFVPPYMDPPNPNVHPLIWQSLAVFGSHMSMALEENRKAGITNGIYYTGWWEGASIYNPWWHNQIGILTEAASVKVASPIYIEKNELSLERGGGEYRLKMNFANPWKGGWWRLRDIVEYELIADFAVIKCASLYKNDLLLNFWKMGKDAIERGKNEPPYAYIIPPDQWDYLSAVKLTEVLMLGGVEVHRAKSPFKIGYKEYPEETFVIFMDQPFRNYIKDILEIQKHPDIRQYKGGPPLRPYDVTGWTLGLMFNVNVEEINVPLKGVVAEKLNSPPYSKHPIPKSDYLVLDPRENMSFKATNKLLKNGFEVWRAEVSIKGEGYSFPEGAFIVKSKSLDILKKRADDTFVKFYKFSDFEHTKNKELKPPRIGLYKPWVASMDEGWTRYLFDKYEFNYKNMENKDFKKEKLIEDFDVIVIPDMNASVIVEGRPTDEFARYFTPLPPEYSGGIGKEGVENLKKFVNDGGILILLDDSTDFAIEHFKIPVINALRNLRPEEFFCPGSLIKLEIDNTHPIGWGLPKRVACMFSNSRGFRTLIPSGHIERKVIAEYPDEPLLLSGWILGDENLRRLAAIVDVKSGKGHIILFGFKVQFRAQTLGTFKLFFNSLFLR
ncbi:MAG: M14 family zinc carboxypeptidase [Candidatus Aminicenantia bacterium]